MKQIQIWPKPIPKKIIREKEWRENTWNRGYYHWVYKDGFTVLPVRIMIIKRITKLKYKNGKALVNM